MASPRPQSSASTIPAQRNDARGSANESLVKAAEKELLAALVEQSSPALGVYSRPLPAERAAFDRAADAICREAHRLGLRAEELVIAIKKAWAQLAQVRATRLAERDGDVLRETVSTSIELFFESRDGEGPRTP